MMMIYNIILRINSKQKFQGIVSHILNKKATNFKSQLPRRGIQTVLFIKLSEFRERRHRFLHLFLRGDLCRGYCKSDKHVCTSFRLSLVYMYIQKHLWLNLDAMLLNKQLENLDVTTCQLLFLVFGFKIDSSPLYRFELTL